VRGFVRSYAKLLQLDAQPLLDALPAHGSAQEQSMLAAVDVPFPTLQSARVQNYVWLGAALLFGVVVIGFALWSLDAPHTVVAPDGSSVEESVALPEQAGAVAASSVQEAEVTHAELAPSAKPVLPPAKQHVKQVKPAVVIPAQAAVVPLDNQGVTSVINPEAVPAIKPEADTAIKPEAAPAIPAVDPVPQAMPAIFESAAVEAGAQVVPSKLRLVFGEESWTEIKDRDGNVLSSKMHAAGTEMNLEGRAPFSMMIGRARSVALYHRGVQVDLTPYVNSRREVARVTVK
jgi:cytoskeleton protein RodZ